MIPAQGIAARGNVVPRADQRQVERDLVIVRALVEIFSEDMLRTQDGFVAGRRSFRSRCAVATFPARRCPGPGSGSSPGWPIRASC